MSRHGAQALWGRETMAGMADGGLAAYGMPVGGRLVGTPSFGIGTSGHGRDYRMGYGLTVAQGGAMHFDLGVYANRRVFGPGGSGERRWKPAHRALVIDTGFQAVTPAAGGAPKVLQSIVSRAGGGRGLLGNRRYERDKSTRGAILREQP